ncbi:DNA-directed RNA polymerase III 37/80 kDa polypeptide [Hyphomicrobiales bacterium]|nr:DNA-directed RNA polymerase III 37/80 kDa polypeptide [Hyphomicrobiales bacterium]CAH1702997.1 DNA-directed RNA polymerase III 37/80 kDa polypeptide [Hyphomicrobiales bacterium]CAI0347181.1 hypothetical protein BO1005MUT1_540017 [Hyphomicrobiales bacterium]
MRLQPNSIKEFHSLCHRLIAAPAKYLHLTQAEILINSEVGKKFEMLENHTHPGAKLRKIRLLVSNFNPVENNSPLLDGLQGINAFNER